MEWKYHPICTESEVKNDIHSPIHDVPHIRTYTISLHCASLGNNAEDDVNQSDLFSIAMESDTAYRLMQELCKLLDVPYPPDPNDTGEINVKELQNAE
jgi:hypothetical protein